MQTQTVSAHGEYALATGQRAVHRLKVLEDVYGAGTLALLQRAGIRPGLRIADIGCGVGVVSRVLANLTGPDGSVVGVDASAEQVEQARLLAAASGLQNASFIEADATKTWLPRASFDLVYCRFLLIHLFDPEAALREMTALLKPGGVLVCEDGDLTAVGSVPATALNAFADLFGRLAPIRGVDYAIGRRLYHLIAAEGMTNIHIQIHQPVLATGEPKSLIELSVREAGSSFVDAGLIEEPELQSVLSEMRHATEDPNVLAMMAPMTQIWAIKS